MRTLEANVDRVQKIITALERSTWIPELLVLFVGYFFFQTGWAKATTSTQ